jgi:hypothetical protein
MVLDNKTLRDSKAIQRTKTMFDAVKEFESMDLQWLVDHGWEVSANLCYPNMSNIVKKQCGNIDRQM